MVVAESEQALLLETKRRRKRRLGLQEVEDLLNSLGIACREIRLELGEMVLRLANQRGEDGGGGGRGRAIETVGDRGVDIANRLAL